MSGHHQLLASSQAGSHQAEHIKQKSLLPLHQLPHKLAEAYNYKHIHFGACPILSQAAMQILQALVTTKYW